MQRSGWLILTTFSVGKRYKQAKPDDVKKPNDTPPNEALFSTTPPIPDLQSPPQSKRSLEPPDLNSYFVQNTNWAQDQAACQPDAHISWPPIDFAFPLQQTERCASTGSQNDQLSREDSTNWVQDQPADQPDTHISWPPIDFNFLLQQAERCPSQNDELSREGSTTGYLNGLDDSSVQASPEYTVSSEIRGQFSHFLSVGRCRCHPSLTPPFASSSAVRAQNRLPSQAYSQTRF